MLIHKMGRGLRITFLLPGVARPNGGYRVVYQYASALAAHGNLVSVIHAEVLEGDLVRIQGSRENFRAIGRSWMHRKGPSWFKFPSNMSVREVYRLSASDVPASDVIVATGVQTAHLASFASNLQDAAGVYFLQAYEEWAGGEDFVRQTWELPLYRIAVARWLVAIGASRGLRVALVPNAVDTNEFPLGPPVAQRTVDLTSMVSEQSVKRTDLVVNVMQALLFKRPMSSLVTFGTCPRPAGLPEQVRHFRSPARSHLSNIYMQSKIYLCTSDEEGWGLPVAEAMSSGASVVSTLNSGVQEFGKGVVCFVPVGRWEPMLEAVEELLGDSEQIQRMANLGSARMRSYSSADAARLFGNELLKAAELGGVSG